MNITNGYYNNKKQRMKSMNNLTQNATDEKERKEKQHKR